MNSLQINGNLWLAWGVYWLVLSKNVNKTESSESFVSRFLHLGPTGLAFILIFTHSLDISYLGDSLFSDESAHGIPGIFLTALGLGFAVWARVHLGRYWSAAVTLKKGHKLIRTGPYRIVRHPIYTGIFLGILGSSLNRGTVGAWLATLIVVIAYLRKIKIEEKVLTGLFGDEYVAYKKEVKALIPFLL